MTEAVYYAWVRVGDGEPEPAAITGKKPNRKATTLGCPDTFDVDDPTSGCSIVLLAPNYALDPRYGQASEAEIETIAEDAGWSNFKEVTAGEAVQREKAYQAAIRERPHSYAGFGRRIAQTQGDKGS